MKSKVEVRTVDGTGQRLPYSRRLTSLVEIEMDARIVQRGACNLARVSVGIGAGVGARRIKRGRRKKGRVNKKRDRKKSAWMRRLKEKKEKLTENTAPSTPLPTTLGFTDPFSRRRRVVEGEGTCTGCSSLLL
jgi:hypothetical protein